MSIAAAPSYLGKDFNGASPGMRFGMLLPIWTDRADQEQEVKQRAAKKSREGQEVAAQLEWQGMSATIAQLARQERNRLPGLWEKNDFAAREAWKRVTQLTSADRACIQALRGRQSQLFGTVPAAEGLCLDAKATAPFTTGLGNEHPLENGFTFLNPYGLPYLPGSGVKGVLRQAARELASGDWGDAHGWRNDKELFSIVIQRKKIALSMLDVLFGRETQSGDAEHVRGVLSFWDVIPQIAGDSLAVEIMTPHQGHYYQWKKDQHGNLIEVSPHESGQPIPIPFLTVPPGSGFAFHVVCDLPRLHRLAPELAQDDRWKTLLTAAFEHAFTWLGFGAKTAVGYGAMQRDRKAEAARQDALEEKQRAAARSAMTEQRRAVEDFITYMKNRSDALRGKVVRPNGAEHDRARKLAKAAMEEEGWTHEERRAAADAIELWLPKVVNVVMKEEHKKLKLTTLRGES